MKIRLHRRRKWRNKLGRVAIKPSPDYWAEFDKLLEEMRADFIKRTGVPKELLYGTNGKLQEYV